MGQILQLGKGLYTVIVEDVGCVGDAVMKTLDHNRDVWSAASNRPKTYDYKNSNLAVMYFDYKIGSRW